MLVCVQVLYFIEPLRVHSLATGVCVCVQVLYFIEPLCCALISHPC